MRIFNLAVPLTPESDRMLTFDALRFIAASGIVFQHTNSFLYPAALRTEMKEPTFGLALLVDLFFLLSGYVIAYVYGSKIASLSDYLTFLQKRVARLWPLHIVTFVVFTAVYFVAVAAGMKGGAMPELSASCLARTAFMLHAIFPCEGASVNPVSWSISAEMTMYAIFPLLYLALARNKATAIVGIIVAAAALATLSWSLTAHEWTQSIAFLRALPSFTFGVCLCRILSGQARPTSGQRSILLLLLSASVLVMFYFMMNGGSALTVLACICLACVLAAFIDRKTTTNAVMRTAAGLGRLTYSIYMIHFLLVTIIVNVVADKILQLSAWPMGFVIGITYLLVVFLSLATYSWIEMPLRRALSPRAKVPPKGLPV